MTRHSCEVNNQSTLSAVIQSYRYPSSLLSNHIDAHPPCHPIISTLILPVIQSYRRSSSLLSNHIDAHPPCYPIISTPILIHHHIDVGLSVIQYQRVSDEGCNQEGTLLFLGLIGNGFIIFVFFRKLSMRTVSNYIIVNLAVTDIIFVAEMMLWVVLAITQVADRFLYNLFISMDIICMTSSMLCVTLISLDRFDFSPDR
ncbi:predicted protein [Nematostella vectensis]|uniref:G-protein coupled receptors family 1 profile domain-containing protein n=1 Tax=Nematostella vectensis TaxID=45351 RepID=A7RYW9_NEMVE|nr:predicted protein [Nematostella vectensis]|eukprot:XP_001635363.1 predicted protein [Nematostella vectensis]